MAASTSGWVSPNGVEVDIQPFMSKGWQFITLRMVEVIGGKIAEGSISFRGIGDDESLKVITDLHNFTISIRKPEKKGVQYKIKAFITTRSWTLNYLDIKFVCIPDRKFFAEPRVLNQPDITTALKQLWPDPETLKLRCESDLANDTVIQQLGDSNYNLCKKLALSYKKNSIFCFGVEGFMIKDIIGKDSLGQDEPGSLVVGDGQVLQTSGYNLNYNFKIYKQPEDPWASEDYSEKKQSQKMTALTINEDYYLVNRDYHGLLGNYVHNKNLMESRMYSSFTVITPNDLPDFKIGDTVKYVKSTETKTSKPIDTFTVTKMSYFISTENTDKDEHGNNFSVTAIFRGIQEGGAEFPTDDSLYDN